MLTERSTNQTPYIVQLTVNELESLIRNVITDALKVGKSVHPDPSPVEEPLLSIEELCRKLQVSRDLIYRLRKDGRLHGYAVGKRKFFRLSEVLNQLKSSRKSL